MSNAVTWSRCVDDLEHELSPQQFNTWIRPLHAVSEHEQNVLRIQAPNRFVKDHVTSKFLPRIVELVSTYKHQESLVVEISAPGGARHSPKSSDSASLVAPPVIDSQATSRPKARNGGSPSNGGLSSNLGRMPIKATSNTAINRHDVDELENSRHVNSSQQRSNTKDSRQPTNPAQSDSLEPHAEVAGGIRHAHSLIKHYTFNDFVEGKSNQLARAAATQVAKGSGTSYNPLFLYGGVGLGKTHLMHAVGHEILKRNPNARVVYLHSERFVADMVKALQLNAINEFKRYYRSVDALLIDDIQFFADKDRSQEEFFHTFNALLEGNKQMILTCDRYPKEIKGLEERLKSRFGWGLTCAMDPPDLETRVAIVNKKAELEKVVIPNECAFFIASKVRSNVRELEGALKRIIAQAKFTNSPIDIGLVKDSMRDLLALQDRLVTIDNIQRTVAEYFRIKVSDLTSKRRSRSVARPRQIAMTLAKELTNHSLPEIGNDFGGRDHTTVLHACRKIKELREENADLAEDYQNLLRSLTT